MRRLATVVSTIAFALSGLAISPANAAEISEVLPSASTPRFSADEIAMATPAIFDPGVQNDTPSHYFNSVSCPSAGNCVAAGQFNNADGFRVAFTQSQTNGVWGTGIPVTFGAGIQNTAPNSYFTSVSCPSEGNCVAAGKFINAGGGSEAFTQTQLNGLWDTAMPAAFGAGLQNTRPDSYFSSISCPSAGNCVAAGTFKNTRAGMEAFTQTKTSGIWGSAIPATFSVGIQSMYPDAYFNSISCPSAGECVAAGSFRNANFNDEAFTQTQINGQWDTAVPATFAAGIQNTDPYSRFNAVSCPSEGNCVAVGVFSNPAERSEAFTQTQKNGVWATAIPAAFAAGIQNANRGSGFNSVSCPSVGNCVAAGSFENATSGSEAFTQTQTNGVWATAIPATFGAGIQGTYLNAESYSVSCASVGNCVVAGYFANTDGNSEAFTQTQSNGRWATAIPVTFGPEIQSLTPNTYLGSVACLPEGYCLAVGEFTNASGGTEAFSQKITLTLEPPAVAQATKATNVTKVVGFATSSSALTVAQKVVLKSLVTKAGKKATFVITGTAGKLPGLADKKVKSLATKRGEIVKAYLVKLGVNKSKITVRAQVTNQGIPPKTKVLARYLESK
jgi:hypothetical protein